MQKITPCLWFDGKAEEAMRFYMSIFPDSEVLNVTHYGEPGPGPKGGVLAATFRLRDQEFMALNGGPHFQFTPAVSFFVACETQDEIDVLWERLLTGGQPQRCGWLTDQFGLSWQIVPTALGRMLQDPDAAKANRAMTAMLGMIKLDIAALEKAHAGR